MRDYQLIVPIKKMQLIANDAKKCAKAAHLTYVSDIETGIQRIKKGKMFVYFLEGKKVTDQETIDRIKKLVIPPAWENVWICKDENGHLQATGQDIRKRKQYRYHSQWNELRNQTKFSKLLLFGEKLPLLRLQLEKDLSRKEHCLEKVLAAAISIMERTYIRIGNSEYEKSNGSYGLTTLKDQHVKFEGNTMKFSFKGKKGITHSIKLTNPKLARIIKQSREIPGKELFQYYDENGNTHAIDSGMVNKYIQEITGEEFTAKDFRTWAGTLNALNFFKELGTGETAAQVKKKIINALEFVSKKLGNTKTVCKKYYVHPLIIDLFEKQSLFRDIDELDKIEKDDNLTGWTQNEILLMKILRSHT
jgi:DNA topoisomerase-1